MIAHMKRLLRLFVLAILAHCAIYAAELAGIWMGETAGRNGEKQDIAFRFKMTKGILVGVMFGDESDLPVEDLKVDGDNVSFSVTTVNYYSGAHSTLVYSGTLADKEMHLTRQRKGGPAAGAPDRQNGKQEIVLKRVTL
jgi:hypothetical protein